MEVQHLEIMSGASLIAEMAITDEDGQAVNLTGMTITFQASKNGVIALTKTVGSGITVTDAPAGLILLRLTTTETALLSGTYEWQISVVSGIDTYIVALGTLTAPLEPVSLSEAKAYMRVEIDDDDSLISALITTARRQAEEYTRRAFVTQTLDVWYDNDDLFEYGEFIELPRLPVSSITSIKSYDSEDVETTMTSTSYRLSSSVEGRIVLTATGEWPSELRKQDCLTIRYVAGYGAASAVPEDIKTAIKAMVLAAYESRCNVTIDEGRAFLEPYRVYTL